MKSFLHLSSWGSYPPATRHSGHSIQLASAPQNWGKSPSTWHIQVLPCRALHPECHWALVQLLMLPVPPKPKDRLSFGSFQWLLEPGKGELSGLSATSIPCMDLRLGNLICTLGLLLSPAGSGSSRKVLGKEGRSRQGSLLISWVIYYLF